MRVVRETDVGDAGDGHQNGHAEQREAARPPAGIPVPALAEDVIQRRTSKSTVTCRHHDTSDRPPRPSWSWRFRFSTVKAVGCCQMTGTKPGCVRSTGTVPGELGQDTGSSGVTGQHSATGLQLYIMCIIGT